MILDGEEFQFEGVCNGKVIRQRKGTNGFGYDSVFMPVGSNKTFAEMDLQEKNLFSHRTKATQKLVAFLNTLEPKIES